MVNKKSYGLKTKEGNIASVTFDGKRKPSKKVIESISTMVDLAAKMPVEKHVPCNNCQGGGCSVCNGFGYWIEQ